MDKDIQNIQESTQNIQPVNKKKIISIPVIIFFILILSAFFYSILRVENRELSQSLPDANPLKKIIPSPTPYPFRELTIPYLRERTYRSEIVDESLSYQSANYTAYLASYNSDGLKINGLLTRPNGSTPDGGWPAIIFIHGYIPPAQYQTTGAAYYDYVDYLARNGFVVFKIDLRGHGNSQGQPGGAYFSADYIIDTLNAYSALQNTAYVNPQKIGLWGHSMAGNVILRAQAAKPDIPAIVIWAGAVYSYTDREKYGINDASYQPSQNASERQRLRQRLTELYGTDYDPDNIFWREFVPTNYLGDIKGAIQINHAVNDPVVDIGYSRDLAQLLDESAIPHELHEYSDGGHNISGASFVEAMENTVRFYKTYLK